MWTFFKTQLLFHLSHTTATLKEGKGYQNWHKQVKLSKYYLVPSKSDSLTLMTYVFVFETIPELMFVL